MVSGMGARPELTRDEERFLRMSESRLTPSDAGKRERTRKRARRRPRFPVKTVLVISVLFIIITGVMVYTSNQLGYYAEAFSNTGVDPSAMNDESNQQYGMVKSVLDSRGYFIAAPIVIWLIVLLIIGVIYWVRVNNWMRARTVDTVHHDATVHTVDAAHHDDTAHTVHTVGTAHDAGSVHTGGIDTSDEHIDDLLMGLVRTMAPDGSTVYMPAGAHAGSGDSVDSGKSVDSGVHVERVNPFL